MEWVVNWFSDTFDKFIQFFKDLVSGFIEWATTLIDSVPKEIFASIMDALASVLESIPAPSFMSQAQSFFNGIPSTIVYFFQFFAVAEGLAMIISAITLRFLIRRIPFIG
jgi:ABC-type proline/glycine betaine transport system permease subunit